MLFRSRKGELRLPQSLAVDANGRLLVVSTGNSRVELFGLDGYSDPHVLEAGVRLRLATWPTRRRPRRPGLWAIVEVPGHAAAEIVGSSLTANGVAARGGSVRGDRFWAAFDHASIVATLPPEGGWVVVRGELGDGSEFEAVGRLDDASPSGHPDPTVPERLAPTRSRAAARGVSP